MQLERSIGLIGLTFVAVGGVLGSGWLFAPLLAAEQAGPAAVLAWVIGAFAVLLLAMTFAEVTAILPVAGGLARIPYFSHGNVVAGIMGWTAWIGYAVMAPIEVSIMLNYLAPEAPWAFGANSTRDAIVLSPYGVGLVVLMMAVMTVINAFGVAFFARINTSLTWFKIILPIVVGVILIASRFDVSNFTDHGGFAPFGLSGVFAAVTTGGVVFAFIGFRHAIDMAGETKNPQVTIPIALVLALVICGGIYLLLQVAFIGALDKQELANGWKGITFGHDGGPLAAIAQTLALLWLVSVIVGGAIISPFGSALVATGSNGRLVMALANNGFFGATLKKLSPRGVPLHALVLNLVVGTIAVIALPFHELVALNSSAITLSLASGPLALLALRRLAPNQERWFRLPAAPVLAGLAFIFATLIVYWSGWDTLQSLGLAMGVGVVFFVWRHRSTGLQGLELRGANWLLPYIAAIGLVSAFGQFDGSGDIPLGWDMAILAAVSVVLLVLAVRVRISREKFQQRHRMSVATADPPPQDIQ
ncbi:MAG: APC family permease [Pseudomonadota bacterium]